MAQSNKANEETEVAEESGHRLTTSSTISEVTEVAEMTEKTKKYYFVVFYYGASEKTLENDVFDEHPLKWFREANKRYPGQYVLKDWKEITEEEYELYKDNR